MSLHHRFGEFAAVNVRGYRGPLAKRKQPGERRIVVLGGSTAFGYGLVWREAFPALLEQQLQQLNERMSVSVINLAYNSEGAYAFPFILRAYDRLDYDVALFYSGYNDLRQTPNTIAVRQSSPVFRLTGYFPIFPLIFTEKAMALRSNGHLEAAYGNGQTVFRPTLARQMTAAALEAAATISQALERQLGRLTSVPEEAEALPETGCGEVWASYCERLHQAIDVALSRGKSVLVVTEPYISDRHVEQQRAVAGMLRARFGAQPRVQHVNLGAVVDLHDTRLSYDGMHLTRAGNERIAEHLVGPVLGLLGQGAAKED